MTDLRARLTDALAEHFGISKLGHRSIEEFVAGLSSLTDIAIVELPEINSQTNNSWYFDDGSAVWFDNTGGVRVRGTIASGPRCLSDPRALAAALLAAANTAEQQHD
jgi:hypothetical protein